MSRQLTYKGKTQPIADWAIEVGISSDAIRGRLGLGWSVDEALSRPIKARVLKNLSLSYKGKTLTASAWAKELNLNPKMIYRRNKKGWDVEHVLFGKPTGGRIIRATGKSYE